MSQILGDLYMYDKDYHRFCQYLGIDRYKREDIDVARKVAYVRDFLDIGKKLSEVEALSKLDDMRKGMGLTGQGILVLDELYQRTRLEDDRNREKEVLEEIKQVTQPNEEKKVVKKEKVDVKSVQTNEMPNIKKQVQEALSDYFKKES